MARVYNFSPGPSVLPEEALATAAREMLEYRDTGMSVMEMSHRSKAFLPIIEGTEALLREVMGIPAQYKVLFLQGGASLQFSMVPMNLMTGSGKAEYLETGSFAAKALKEAQRYGKARAAASSKDRNFSYIPPFPKFDPEADYVHITTNNTIYGTRFTEIPDTGTIPLVADMSSNILSEPMDITKFALIYAGAQKNLGPAGVTIVIIREDLVGRHMEITPTMLKYETHTGESSLYNTPPTFSIYMVGLVLTWLKDIGGAEAAGARNHTKANLLYEFLDNSKLFKGTAEKKDRSIMNVTFVLPTDELNDKFVKEAAKQGLVNLKGHRSVGGMRASIYNAMPEEGVRKLVEFMNAFEKGNR